MNQDHEKAVKLVAYEMNGMSSDARVAYLSGILTSLRGSCDIWMSQLNMVICPEALCYCLRISMTQFKKVLQNFKATGSKRRITLKKFCVSVSCQTENPCDLEPKNLCDLSPKDAVLVKEPCEKIPDFQAMLNQEYNHLVCPISKQMFHKPVVAQDSYIYEYDYICQILKSNHRKSPITGEKMSANVKCLASVFMISGQVSDFVEKMIPWIPKMSIEESDWILEWLKEHVIEHKDLIYAKILGELYEKRGQLEDAESCFLALQNTDIVVPLLFYKRHGMETKMFKLSTRLGPGLSNILRNNKIL